MCGEAGSQAGRQLAGQPVRHATPVGNLPRACPLPACAWPLLQCIDYDGDGKIDCLQCNGDDNTACQLCKRQYGLDSTGSCTAVRAGASWRHLAAVALPSAGGACSTAT